jgi:succinate dehydrogenase cytochrome b subunit
MTAADREFRRIRAERDRPGPVLRKAPGPTAWFDIRRRGTGHWAFSLMRITGLGLVFYLYLHLAVLSLLLAGPSSWDGFLGLATTPLFLGLDVLLVIGLVIHGLNGLRVALIGTGVVPDRQKALFFTFMVVGGIVVLATILHLAGSS